MNLDRGRGQIRAGVSPRSVWLAVSSLVAGGLLAVVSISSPATAAPSAAMTPSSLTAVVGASVVRTSAFDSSLVPAPTTLTVLPAAQGGLRLDTVTTSSVRLSGTPTVAETYVFTVVGSDETTTDTATLTVVVSCPDLIKVTDAIAAACLPVYPEVSLDPPAAPSVGPDPFGGLFFGPMLMSLPPTFSGGDPHIAYDTQADGCAACHRMHADTAETFSNSTPTSHSVDCLVCHDGTGATTNVKSEYTALGAVVNVPSTRSYYTHDALAVSTGHRAASSDEEGGSVAANEFQGVANRHSDCVDCHNPHAVSGGPASEQRITLGVSSGWAISGRLQSVSVATAAVDTSTAFVAHAETATSYEYELCLKCHSDFTKITTINPSSTTSRSQDWFDKSAEINPATAGNNSFHPIMARGKNLTDTMTANLAGASDYRVSTFTVNDTVRCSDCHADSATVGATQFNATHASPNRGMLNRPYRDRLLLTTSEPGSTSRFALCFTCHTDVPFKSQTSSGTAFRYHWLHTMNISGKGTYGTGSIDSDGAGNGDALCAECHFRLHSNINAVAGQTIDGSRLVNFAPNVQTWGGVIAWTKRNGQTAGTCTLMCHGQDHQGTAY